MGWLGYVVVALCIGIAGQVVMVRSRLLGNVVFAFLLSGGFMGLWLIAVLAEYYGQTRLIGGVLVYAFACELYLFCATFVFSSVSANLLMRLQENPMTGEEIARLYDNAQMASLRVDRLIQVKWVEEGPEGLRVTRKGMQVAAAFVRVRCFFRHEA